MEGILTKAEREELFEKLLVVEARRASVEEGPDGEVGDIGLQFSGLLNPERRRYGEGPGAVEHKHLVALLHLLDCQVRPCYCRRERDQEEQHPETRRHPAVCEDFNCAHDSALSLIVALGINGVFARWRHVVAHLAGEI